MRVVSNVVVSRKPRLLDLDGKQSRVRRHRLRLAPLEPALPAPEDLPDGLQAPRTTLERLGHSRLQRLLAVLLGQQQHSHPLLIRLARVLREFLTQPLERRRHGPGLHRRGLGHRPVLLLQQPEYVPGIELVGAFVEHALVARYHRVVHADLEPIEVGLHPHWPVGAVDRNRVRCSCHLHVAELVGHATHLPARLGPPGR